jgi:MFS family permease
MLWAIAFATPFFLVFGWLSDRIGRKWIMLSGMLLGVLLYRPIFSEFLEDTDSKTWAKGELVVLKSDTAQKKSDKGYHLIQITTEYKNDREEKFTKVTNDTIPMFADSRIDLDKKPMFINKEVNSGTYLKFIFLVWVMIVLVTMVYGPIAAFLVEMFPTKIRYTSMSLPYHIGNGVFGGLVPFIGLLLTTTYPSDPLVGLNYPIGVAALCFIIGTIYLSNKIDKDVQD